MDMQSFDEANLTAAQIGTRVKYIKEGMEVNVVRWGERIIEVELPNTVVLEVIETDPGLKGDTATGGSKAAKVETGASINVPLFVNIGDRIKSETREDIHHFKFSQLYPRFEVGLRRCLCEPSQSHQTRLLNMVYS
jgi:elongation factor P